MFTNKLAENLKRLMKQHGLSGKMLAKIANVSEMSITRYLQGSSAKLEHMIHIAKYFNISIDELYGLGSHVLKQENYVAIPVLDWLLVKFFAVLKEHLGNCYYQFPSQPIDNRADICALQITQKDLPVPYKYGSILTISIKFTLADCDHVIVNYIDTGITTLRKIRVEPTGQIFLSPLHDSSYTPLNNNIEIVGKVLQVQSFYQNESSSYQRQFKLSQTHYTKQQIIHFAFANDLLNLKHHINMLSSHENEKAINAFLSNIDTNKNSLLHLLAKAKIYDEDVFTFLLTYLNVNQQNNRQQSLLHHCAQYGNYSMAKALLANKADIEIRDDEGDTPIAWAAYSNQQAILSLCFENSANINTQNNDGRTPLHWAHIEGNNTVIELLISLGADQGITDNTGELAHTAHN